MNDLKFREKLQEIEPISFNDTCYRKIDKRFDPLDAKGSKISSGRWHIRGNFDAIYTSENELTCDEELKRRIDDDIISRDKFKTYKLTVKLTKILDLTNKSNLIILEVEESDLLSGNIEITKKIDIPNQLAEAAYNLGFEGILVKSATKKGNNIVLFPENITKGSNISVVEK